MLTNPLHLVGVAVLASAVSAQADSPEAVIRSFVHAMYSNDLGTYEALTLPIPGRERLEKGGAVNVEAKEELEHNPRGGPAPNDAAVPIPRARARHPVRGRSA
jgi:hypothetical protein